MKALVACVSVFFFSRLLCSSLGSPPQAHVVWKALVVERVVRRIVIGRIGGLLFLPVVAFLGPLSLLSLSSIRC